MHAAKNTAKTKAMHATSARAMPEAATVSPVASMATGHCACGGSCPRCGQKQQRVQAKLNVSQPGDALEQEADQVAEQVMRMPDTSSLTRGDSSENFPTRSGPLVQRRAQGMSSSGPALNGEFAERLQTRVGAGHALSSSARAFFEPRFGNDLSSVRLHTDHGAGEMARSIDAHAFTHGSDIYFAPGAYDQSSHAGRTLLAHELAHTQQQRGAPTTVARQLHPAVPDMTYEERLEEGLWEALPAFGTWLVLGLAILVLFAAGIYLAVSYLLAHVPPAWAAWISLTLSVIGILTGLAFFVDAMRRGADAWREFDRAIRGATTHAQLHDAGVAFGSTMASVVIEVVGAVMSLVGGIIGGVRAFGLLTAPPANGPIVLPRVGPGTSPPTGSPPVAGTPPVTGTPPTPPVTATPPVVPRPPVVDPAPPVVEPPITEPPVVETPPVRPRAGVRATAPVRASLSRDAMRALLQRIWNQTPLLQRLSAARTLRGEALVTELRAILAAFQEQTGIVVEEVAEGVVQAATSRGNFSSLRSAPGRLQIEAQVFRDPQMLLTEMMHELAFYYSRLFGGGSSPLLGEGPLSALELLEMMIQEGGNIGSILTD